MTDNMEDMLMMGSDDSSDDSGDEIEVSAGSVAAQLASAQAQAPNPPPAPAAPAPGPMKPPRGGKDLAAAAKLRREAAAASAGLSPPASHPPPAATARPTDTNQRLKALYGQKAPAPPGAPPPASAPGRPVPIPVPVSVPIPTPVPVPGQQMHHQSLPQQQQQQQQQYQHPLGGQQAAMGRGAPSVHASRSGPKGIKVDVEPTPLNAMIARGQGKQGQEQHGQRRQQQIPARSSSSSSSRRSVSEATAEAKKRKEQFLMFTRVLMKYLESKDPQMHVNAKNVIKQCAERNKAGDPEYASLTHSMQVRLRREVGETYWKKADDYLKHFLRQKQLGRGSSSVGAGKAPAGGAPGPSGHSRQQQQPQAARVRTEQPSVTTPDQRRMAAAEKMKQIEKTSAQRRADAEAKAKKKAETDAKKRAEIEAKKKKFLQQKQKAKEEKKKAKLKARAKASMKGSPTTKSSDAVLSPKDPPSVPSPDELETEEVAELMEMLDHAVRYDDYTASVLLSEEFRAELDLDNEQERLLFGDGDLLGRSRVVVVPAQGNSGEGNDQEQGTDEEHGNGQQHSSKADRPMLAAHRGWSSRNMLGARTAWARIRLAERIDHHRPKRSTLPGEKPAEVPPLPPEFAWQNEEEAESDEALALLSEATEVYLRSMLEGAVGGARQRLNIDGVRLWYQQHSGKKAPLCLRLGCDVKRQEALAVGNAAMVVKRMEEALGRQKMPQRERNLKSDETLLQAVSMSDLSKRPRLARAAERAEFDAKRSFDIYGGKDSGAPPLGRIPKKAKILAKDLRSCVNDPSFPWRRKRAVASALL